MDITQRVSIIKSSLKKIKEIATETKNIENDGLSSKSVDFIDDLWINTLNEAFRGVQKYFKDINSLKEVNQIITDLVKYRVKNIEEIFYPTLYRFTFLIESIEKNSKHNLKEFSTLFSPIFDFIIKNRLEIGDINILDFNDPIDKTNVRKWYPREESKILLWFLIIGSYKNIGKTPEEVGKIMFDDILLPFHTEGIREYGALNLSLETNAKVFKSIVELEPLYFNLFPEFTKYLCSVEKEYFKNMEITINNSKKIGEFENLLLKVSLDNMNDSEWREKNGISRIVYDNITKSTKIPSVQKLKMLKSIGLSKKLN